MRRASLVSILFPLAVFGCSSGSGDPESLDTSGGDVRTNRTVFHGTIAVDSTGAKEPGGALHDPFAWDGDGAWAALCAPAKIEREHPAHSWDIDVTEEETELELMSMAIKLFPDGKPDIEHFHADY